MSRTVALILLTVSMPSMSASDEESAVTTSSEFGDEPAVDYKIHKLNGKNVDEIGYLTNRMEIVDEEGLSDVMNNVTLISADETVLAIFITLDVTEARQTLHSSIVKAMDKLGLVPGKTSVIISERVMNLPVNEIYRVYGQVLAEHSDFVFISRFRNVSGKDLNDLIVDFPEIKPKELKKLPCNTEELFLIDLCERCEVVDVKGAHYRVMHVRENEIRNFLTKLSNEIE